MKKQQYAIIIVLIPLPLIFLFQYSWLISGEGPLFGIVTIIIPLEEITFCFINILSFIIYSLLEIIIMGQNIEEMQVENKHIPDRAIKNGFLLSFFGMLTTNIYIIQRWYIYSILQMTPISDN